MIQSKARQQQQDRHNIQTRDSQESRVFQPKITRRPEDQLLHKIAAKGSPSKKKVRKRPAKKSNKVDTLVLVPSSLEEAPMRRQDRRALNALRRRRADKKLIACLFCTILSLAIATIIIVVAWFT